MIPTPKTLSFVLTTPRLLVHPWPSSSIVTIFSFTFVNTSTFLSPIKMSDLIMFARVLDCVYLEAKQYLRASGLISIYCTVKIIR